MTHFQEYSSIFVFPMCRDDLNKLCIGGQWFDRKMVADEISDEGGLNMTVAMVLQIDVTEYRLHFRRSLVPGETTRLRGFFGQAFGGELLLHHHKVDGSLHYAYPRVQFKVLERTAHLVGVAEGSDLITRLWLEVDKAKIGLEEMAVLEASLTRRQEVLGETEQVIEYRFRTPWLGLNQENYHKYDTCACPGERQVLLEQVLTGNCLSLAKAFGLRVGLRLSANASGLSPMRTTLKGVPMIGFNGMFRINFLVPDRLGIGKSVSRGFGTVERMHPERSKPC